MLSDRARALGGSQTSGMRNRARKLKAEGVHVVNFAAGELDQDTSPDVKDAVRSALAEGQTQYTDTLGISSLRERIAETITRKTGVPYTPEDVGFTAGAKQALFESVFVAFQPGDEVIIPSPYWVTFPEQVRLAGATPVFVPTTAGDFQLDPEAVARAIGPRTRGILLNTPHNPTGVVYGAGTLEKVAGLVLRHRLTCIFDECYDELVYAPATHTNIVKLVPELRGQTVLVGSLSKTYCMAGWRAGFLAAPKPFIKAVANLQSHTASNASNLVQYAALAALDRRSDRFVEEVRTRLGRQRAVALEGMRPLPQLPFASPQGAFYLFPDMSAVLRKAHRGERIETVDRLAELLLERAHIAVVPGSAFGSDSHVRISYAIPEREIEAGLAALREFVDELG